MTEENKNSDNSKPSTSISITGNMSGNIIVGNENTVNNQTEQSNKAKRFVITFKEPSPIPSYERTFYWKFPFDLVEKSLVGKPEEIAFTTLCSITVSISAELASLWNLFPILASPASQEDIVKAQEARENLKRVLFWHAVKHVQRQLSDGTLKNEDRIDLITPNSEATRLDISRIPEPNGYTFES